MIRNDSAYIKSTDISAGPKFDRKNQLVYGGSSAYWMTMLKSVLIKNKEVNYTYEELIKGAVEAVDRENSTHLNADKCGRTEIVRRICAFDCSELIECLRNPEYEDMKLVHEIARVTFAKFRARTNLSFASKFCHYACFQQMKKLVEMVLTTCCGIIIREECENL